MPGPEPTPPRRLATFKSRLQQIRRDAGLSQESLAGHLGVKNNTISTWESHTNLRIPGEAYLEGYATVAVLASSAALTPRTVYSFGDLGADDLVSAVRIQQELLDVRKGSLDPNSDDRNVFEARTRAELPRMEQIVAPAAQDIWIFGVSLDGAIVIRSAIAKKAERGVNIHLLAVRPGSPSFIASCQSANVAEEVRRDKLIGNCDFLHANLVEKFAPTVDLRLTEGLMIAGVVARDLDTIDGEIMYQLHLPSTPPDESPLVILRASRDARWYSVFRESLKAFWRGATPYQPGRS